MDALRPTRLTRARALHQACRWEEACAEYAAAAEEPLGVEDLERYAEAAQISGRGDEAIELLGRLFDVRVEAGQLDDAARVAFWLFHALAFNNDPFQAAGWVKRADRVLDSSAAVNPWLTLANAYLLYGMGDFSRVHQALGEVLGAARGEAAPLALCMSGSALVFTGRMQEGLDHLDEAMAAILGHRLSPLATQEVYCLAIVTCEHARDFTRAHAWTRSMAAWLDSLTSLTGAYLGRCRVHRARLRFVAGAWSDALDEIAAVCAELDGGYGQAPCGEAYYQLGELQRLRGEYDKAEAAYRNAADRGWPTQPGLALLRVAQRDTDAAAAGVRRALAEAPRPTTPAGPDTEFRYDVLDLLKAAVDIELARGRVEAANAAAAEFEQLARGYGSPAVRAEADTLRAQIALTSGDPATALPLLRRAAAVWRDQHADYEVAKLNVLLGRACRALGDHDGAQMEFSAAKEVFERIGAVPDLARLEEIVTASEDVSASGGLTAREVEVLRLIARGHANRAIATELHLSERTVHRHVSNIFTKLDVDSRTSAVTYAIKHHIVDVGSL